MATMTGQEAQGRLVEVDVCEPPPVQATVPAGEAKMFRPYDPDQVLLMSPVLAEWIPEGDLAHFVSELVESALDLSAIYASYESERGYPPYDPRLMLKLLIYGYANGVCSSRKLEGATHRDIAVRMLCSGQHPDYRSIARFRARHLEAIAELFVQALRLCAKAGLLGLGSLALDGTKLRANASRHKAMSYDRMTKKESGLEAEIASLRARARALLKEAATTDEREDELYGPTTVATSCPRSCAAARVAWPRSARPRRRWRLRPASVKRRAAPRCRLRAAPRAPPRTAATATRPSRLISVTSPIPTRRS